MKTKQLKKDFPEYLVSLSTLESIEFDIRMARIAIVGRDYKKAKLRLGQVLKELENIYTL